MALISRTLALAAALATMVTARPFNVARNPVPDMITETDWVTIQVPVTLWVDENGNPLSTATEGGNFFATPSSAAATATTSGGFGPAPVVTSSPASSAAPTVTSTTTLALESPSQQLPVPSTIVATTSSSVAPPPPPSPTTTLATSTTTAAPVQRQVTTTTSAAATAAASPAAAAGGDTGAISASSANTCEGTGAACSGDITYYDGGLGACGWNVNTASDMQIALPYEFMGTQSNGNPYCGRSLTIRNPTTGQTVAATVGDKCMGCTGRSIDLTDVLFKTIGGGCDGRCSGFQWWFN